MNIVILASGSGTTAEAFIRAGAEEKIQTKVGLVICNNPKAGVFKRIDSLNQELGLRIETLLVNGKTHPSTEKTSPGAQTRPEESAILDAIKNGGFDLVSLMGYMKKVGPRLVHDFGWRQEYVDPRQAKMVNTHPGLLPDTKGFMGIQAQEHVLKEKLPFAGQTLHVVAENYDEGPIIAEHKVKVNANDTPASLFARVQATEKAHLPLDIEEFIKNRQAYLRGESNG